MTLRLPATAALLLLLFTSAVADLTSDEFTDAFVKALRDAAPDVEIELVGPMELSVTKKDGGEFTAFLDNAYSLYSQDPAALDEVLDNYISSFAEMIYAEETPLAPTNIVPVIKDESWLRDMSASFPEGGEMPSYYNQPLADGLVIYYAEDTPTNIRYVDQDTLEEAGVRLDTIREDAVQNLLDRLPDIEVHGADGLYMIAADGTYEASLILVDSIWGGSNFDIAGDIVIAVPSRDVLLVSGTGNVAELDQLRELAREIFAESPYNVSSGLYVRRDNRWHLLNSFTD